MSSRLRRLLILSLPMMFAAASIVGAAALAQPGAMRVTGMTPTTGSPGTVITITGENFGSTRGSKLVGFNLGRVNLMDVRFWSNTKIQVVVPNLPVGEYTVVLYFDNTYRTYAGWSSSPRFRIIPREIPAQPPPDPRPPFPPRAACTPVPRATNMLCNPDFTIVGPLGPMPPSRTVPDGGGAGDSAAKYWSLFVNGSGPIKTSLVDSDRAATGLLVGPRKMVHVTTNNGATGILQQFLARDRGPQRVTFAVWVKVVRGKVEVSLGNWGLKLPGGWRSAATSTRTGKWELLSGCSVFHPSQPLPLNQIFIHSSNGTNAEFFLDFVEVKNADPAWTWGGCVEAP